MPQQEIINPITWKDIAQLSATIIGFIGVCLSFWYNRKSLKEVQKGRIHSQKPYLSFEYQPEKLSLKEIRQEKPFWVPVHGSKMEQLVPIQLGKLVNFGTGPALYLKIRFYLFATKVNIDDGYYVPSLDRNSEIIPEIFLAQLSSSHVFPNQVVTLKTLSLKLVEAIEKDESFIEGSIKGYVEITHFDTFGIKYTMRQKFMIHSIDPLEETFKISFYDTSDFRVLTPKQQIKHEKKLNKIRYKK